MDAEQFRRFIQLLEAIRLEIRAAGRPSDGLYTDIRDWQQRSDDLAKGALWEPVLEFDD